jgi:hypothetical protein
MRSGSTYGMGRGSDRSPPRPHISRGDNESEWMTRPEKNVTIFKLCEQTLALTKPMSDTVLDE